MARFVATKWNLTQGAFIALQNVIERTIRLGTLSEGSADAIHRWRTSATAGGVSCRFVARSGRLVGLDSMILVDAGRDGGLVRMSIAGVLLETAEWLRANFHGDAKSDELGTAGFEHEDVHAVGFWLASVIEENE